MEIAKQAWIVFSVIAFLLGSIPFGLVFSKIKGMDVRKVGSGNIGATNVARVLGKGWGLLTLAFDLMKGFGPVKLYCLLYGAGNLSLVQDPFPGLIGLFAVLGHCFSVFLKGRGGKGVATAAGVFIALSPKAFLLVLIVFAVVAKVSGYVSVGSMAASVAAPIAMHFVAPSPYTEPFLWAIALVIWFQHRSNIKRLLEGKEISL